MKFGKIIQDNLMKNRNKFYSLENLYEQLKKRPDRKNLASTEASWMPLGVLGGSLGAF